MNMVNSVLSIAFRHSRSFSSLGRARSSLPFKASPAPPRLPKEEQEIYEQLQKASTGAFSTPNPSITVNQVQESSSIRSNTPTPVQQSEDAAATTRPAVQEANNVNAKVNATGEGEELHPDVRRGAKPEFEGDRNPKTGEIGGPKNEPLRWGGQVDWSYNGRVTDF